MFNIKKASKPYRIPCPSPPRSFPSTRFVLGGHAPIPEANNGSAVEQFTITERKIKDVSNVQHQERQ